MATSAPLGSPQNPEKSVPVDLPFDEKLRLFWQKNERSVYALCVVVLLAIIARGGYDFYQRQREADIESSYAAATTPEKVKGFIAEHPDHPLAGIGALGLADAAYSAHDYTQAQTEYQRAATILKTGPFAGRAKIGAAVAKLEAGDKAGAEESLKQITNDSTQLKPVRAEAAYHLATIAAAAGRIDDASKDLDLVNAADQSGLWSQRALMLRATLPLPAPAPGADAAIKLLPTKP
jgi:predicted negative regulator of RcsB-dependent stress response